MDSLATIGGFDSLECFEVQLVYAAPLPQNAIRGWIGEFQELGAWNVYVPSLRSAIIYGLEVL